ncbi:hypothetical protein ADCFC_19080 [Adlercreutzia hattorii]|uniref:Uncharacterized protein n=1 Tax=Adlercreutzia hattorii TaxID=2707299 RepID=A0A6F8SNJ8_9ACTN|nr:MULTISPECIES: hypothetical protein [Adlercreutzia]BCA89411.1 hypothetical protein ADCFC_20300 [Adlercreutzia hattorii]
MPNKVRIDIEHPCIRLFDKREYAEQFVEGRFRMSMLKCYRKMAEDDSGIGDLYEGIRMVEASVFPSNENPELGNTPEKVSLPLRIPEVEESVVLCATSFREGALESAGEVDGRHLARMSERFSDFVDRQGNEASKVYCAVFSASEMANALRDYAEQRGLAFICNEIEYGLLPLTEKEIKELKQGQPAIYKFLFHKREGYSDQFEYRYAILPKPGDDTGILAEMLGSEEFINVEIPPLKQYQLLEYQVGG